jgi:hypothetical protein
MPFFVTGALTAIRDDNAHLIGFASVIHDATERRDSQEKLVEAREQLAMAQKMEAIGKLTGGIAHDYDAAKPAAADRSQRNDRWAYATPKQYGRSRSWRDDSGVRSPRLNRSSRRQTGNR